MTKNMENLLQDCNNADDMEFLIKKDLQAKTFREKYGILTTNKRQIDQEDQEGWGKPDNSNMAFCTV
jgi:hypothetical protein